ncbi:hypothetical protein VPNG_04881 [Cytospora leucostoma]|uniref:Cytochrome P450 monooxygenase n=1 Tax=Cytospora leucostoma TaxID=1230097 RepID=A0A423XBE9_9PEZI|nr:hypothetical protein VPNG_04881 [Cytospora leucostoma]
MAFILVLGVVLLGLYSLYRWLLPKPLPGIPYNPEATKKLFGDLPSLISEVAETGDMSGWIRKQAERTGAPVTQIFLKPFGKPSLLVCDFREAQDVMVHRTKEFDRSDFVGELFDGIGRGHHITLKTGPEWKIHRRLLQDLMSPGFLHDVAAPSIYASSLNVLRLWELKADMADGRPFPASKDVFNAALDAVLAFGFGAGFKENATKAQLQLLQDFPAEKLNRGSADDPVDFPTAHIGDALSGMVALTHAVERVRSYPNLRVGWWFLTRDKGVKAAVKAKDDCLHEELDKAVQARVEHREKGDVWVRSAVDHMVDREARLAEKEGRQPDFHSPAIMVEVFGFIVAGHDTTSNTLCWGVKFLAEHQEVQQRLRNDLQAAFSAAREEGRLPTADEITKTNLPYLEATMEEILRVGNTVPILDRDATQDTTLLGYPVPKGTHMFFLNTGPSMLTPAFELDESKRSPHSREAKTRAWPNEDIGKFKPERWLTVENGREVFDSQAGPTLPFGTGLRGCFGKRLAYLELRLLLTLVVWNFEFLQCPADLAGYDAIDGVVHGPKKCFVRLRKVA